MSTKIAISIGKGLGHLLQVDDSCSDKKTFKSFLRLLVKIEVSNPLKPGFPLQRVDDEPLWIFLKYERLDIYCISCGRIGHKLIRCLAPPEEKFPQRYSVSLHVNIFSNLLPNSPFPKINQAISQSQPPSSQTRSVKPTQLWNSNLITVPNTQPHLSHTHPLQ
jgi:hypothetical protein